MEIRNSRYGVKGPGPTCDTVGCSGAPAWNIALEAFTGWRFKEKPTLIATEVYICFECGLRAKAEHVLTDMGWFKLECLFRAENKRVPVRELTKLRLQPVLKLT